MRGRITDELKRENIITAAEARAIKVPFRTKRKYPPNPSFQFPKEPMVLWDMAVNDPQTFEADEALKGPQQNHSNECSPYNLRKRVIMCRLSQRKYSYSKAMDRCMELNGTTYDGVFRSGAYFVFWQLEEA